MWYGVSRKGVDWSAAQRHLTVDPRLAGIMKRVGACTLPPRRDYFLRLCQVIVAQQVSTLVATRFFHRLRLLYPGRRPTPTRVLETPTEVLRRIGLSGSKVKYLRALAQAFADGRIKPRRFSSMNDEELIATLTQVPGIGRWSAEVFMIFSLNRPDVLPVGDLGLRKCVQSVYRLPAMPTEEEIRQIARPWQPWRSIATWYLWRSIIPSAPLKKKRA